MQKVAIVGVEGSGKTVMLAGLGELYSHPDEEGYFLTPKNYATATYVSEKIARMRKGEWPVATAEDVLQGLDWTLRRRQGERRRPADVCEVSCLDFAGEVYRYAFVREDAVPTTLEDEVAALKNYVRNADDLIVLINLRDIIVHGVGDNRVQEAMWITNAILSYALDEQQGSDVPRAAIVLSQADSYSQTIKSCGGPKGVLAKYLPHVSNNYDWLDVFAVSAVDKTVQDEDGNPVPAPDFTSAPLRKIMDWIRSGTEDGAQATDNTPQPQPAAEDSIYKPEDVILTAAGVSTEAKKVNGVVFALTLAATAVAALLALFSGHWIMSICIGVFVLVEIGIRDDKSTKSSFGAWLLCALLMFVAGLISTGGCWWGALIVIFIAFGITQK